MLRPKSITTLIGYSFAIWKQPPPMSSQDKEILFQRQVFRKYRAEQQKLYWEKQTIVENIEIDKHMQKLEQQKIERALKFRSAIVNISVNTDHYIKVHQKKHSKLQDRLRKHALEQEVNKMNRQRILQVLGQESQQWIQPQDIPKMKGSDLIPDYIYDETDYYVQLQQQALYYQTVELNRLEEVSDTKKIIAAKNTLMMPVFQDVRNLIKNIKNTPARKLLQEYEVAQAVLKKRAKGAEIAPEEQEKLDRAFRRLLAQITVEQEKKGIEDLHAHLLKVYNLLDSWERYTLVLKLSQVQVQTYMESKFEQNQIFAEDDEIENDQDEEEDQEQESLGEKQSQNFEDVMQSAREQSDPEQNQSATGDTVSDQNSQMEEFEKKIEQQLKSKKHKIKNKDFIKQLTDQIDKQDSIPDIQYNQDQTKEQKSQQQETEDELNRLMEVMDTRQGEFEQEFEQKKEQLPEGESILYADEFAGKSDASGPQRINLRKIFSEEDILNASKFSASLHLRTLQAIEQREQSFNSENYGNEADGRESAANKRLRTSIVCTVFRERLQQYSTQNNLSRSQKNLLVESERLIELIGEKNILEPYLLQRVWDAIK